MTIVPWHKNVQRKSTLTYAVKALGGQWTAVLDKAIAEFNRQMSHHGLKLTLSPVEKGRGPHVVLETQPGNGLHGSAPSQTMRLNRVEYLDLVTIRLPATPRIDPDDPKSREVGPGARLYILVHELIHAVGLSNDEHSSDDVFGAKALLIPKGKQYVAGGFSCPPPSPPPEPGEPQIVVSCSGAAGIRLIALIDPSPIDTDLDGIADHIDSCPLDINPIKRTERAISATPTSMATA